MTLTNCSFPQSDNHKSSTTWPRLEDMWEGRTKGFPPLCKKRRVRRPGRNQDGLDSLARVAEIFSKAAERERASITEADIQTQQTLKGGVVNDIGLTTSLPPPSTEGPNNLDLIRPEPSNDDLVDFRGLAMVPRCYATLLDKACISHPNLAKCSKQSPRWPNFSYRTLGELLFFLNKTKRKEMTHKACKHLRVLWEDAKDLGFDLSWLAPVMESDLSSSSDKDNICLLEAYKHVLKERRDTLHCQLTTLAMQLGEADKELADVRELIRHAKQKLEATEEEFLVTDL